MTQRHAAELALDLTRMPALARSPVRSPIPPNIIELMRIAAASPKACQDAVDATGEPPEVLIDASRFYLQQMLFRPDADCYRILGLQPGASRATARAHMRWLLQWLHPDRNSGLDAVYTDRVLQAWREVSKSDGSAEKSDQSRSALKRAEVASTGFRLPWIEYPIKRRGPVAVWAVPVGLTMASLILCSGAYYFDILALLR